MTILPKKKVTTNVRERANNPQPSTSSGSSERLRHGYAGSGSSNVKKATKKSHPDGQGSSTGISYEPPKKQLRSRSQSPLAINSDDENGPGFRNDELERELNGQLSARGWQIKEMIGDGACMFRAVADQVYGDQEMHNEVRRLCLDYMERNKDHYSQFVTEDFQEYLIRKRLESTHGNHVELQAISEMFARPIEIYQLGPEPINTFHPSTEGLNAPLRLSYHGSVHYNSVVDPFGATIGVGLGLPGLVPGAADAALVEEATRQSELHLEEKMLNDKLHMTDLQRTEQDLQEQISRESYMDYVRTLDKKGKSPTGEHSPKRHLPEGCPIPRPMPSPPHSSRGDQPGPSREAQAPGLYEELLAVEALASDLGCESEDSMMTRAFLMSQQQFMEDLARRENEKDQQPPSTSQK